MDERIRSALAQGQVIDITTTGKSSGLPRRIEIRFRTVDGQIYITGTPGRRGWYANLVANPAFTFHLKRGVTADLPARATPVTDAAARREILTRILASTGRSQELEARLAGSPLVAVSIEGG